MKKHIALVIIFSILISVPLFSDPVVMLSLYNSFFGFHTIENNIISMPEDWFWNGESTCILQVQPPFTFSETFNVDAGIESYLTYNYTSNEIQLSIKELYTDLLFHNVFGLKSGLIKADFGYNGFFHPLHITDFVYEYNNLFGKISVGGEDKGFKGVPGATASFFFPEIMDLKVSLSQTATVFDFTRLYNTYFFTKLSLIYNSLNLNLLCGYGSAFLAETDYTPETKPEIQHRAPVLGSTFSILLPFDILFFFEGILKFESLKPYVDDGAMVWDRDGLFFNSSVRFEYKNSEPLFHNGYRAALEYFYNSEGYDDDMYNSIHDFLGDPQNLIWYSGVDEINNTYVEPVFNTYRNFIHYIHGNINYTITAHDMVCDYTVTTALNERIVFHTLSVSRTIENVILNGLIMYNQMDDRYTLISGSSDFSMFLNIVISY